MWYDNTLIYRLFEITYIFWNSYYYQIRLNEVIAKEE